MEARWVVVIMSAVAVVNLSRLIQRIWRRSWDCCMYVRERYLVVEMFGINNL
jgi:hypothetical protein